jgi:hypothetical protein
LYISIFSKNEIGDIIVVYAGINDDKGFCGNNE